MEFYTAKYTYRLDFSGKIFSSHNCDTNGRSQNSGFQSTLMTLCFILFLTSDAADKRNHGKAAANQTLPPLCNWLQVKFHSTLI